MNHRTFVEEHRSLFGDAVKVATDMAALLDHPCMQVHEEGENRSERARMRLRLFEKLCAFAVQSGAPLLPLDPDLVRASLPEPADDELRGEVERVINHIANQVEGHDARVPRALLETLVHIPSLIEQWGNTRDDFFPVLNHALMEVRLEPLRPDHHKMEIAHAAGETGPSQPARLLIVDDTLKEIVATWAAVCGWPNLELNALHAVALEDEHEDDFCGRIAEAIVQLEHPDIVLMDQGMPPTNGMAVIWRIRSLDPSSRIVFVGNTGGDPGELNAAGAIGNCEKGRNLSSVRRGLARFI